MDRWFEEVGGNAMPGIITYLVGSKLDKSPSREVQYEEAKTLADKHDASFCEVSAKTRENVRKPFIEIVDQIVASPQLASSAKRRENGGIAMSMDIDNLRTGCSC
ncbi:MAG: hypothetical protein M1827_000641 [Pycnora praestabilis]|nr:MAG: hypothetical protein M1827_000641 [Pycnora praestabilis]